jgi:hypothetical protein
LTGRAELASFANRHTRPPAAYHKHLVAEPIIELDRDQAKCTSYFAVLVEDDDGVPRLRNFGLYRDHLVRDADGIWRIHKRAVDVEVLRPGLESMRGPTDR